MLKIKGKANLKNEQGNRTRERCLNAAMALFAERGYHRTTMDDISTSAGVTKGAVYWHFPAKDDLLVALLNWLERHNGGGKREPLHGSARNLLRRFFEEAATLNLEHPWVNRLFIGIGMDATNLPNKIGAALRSSWQRSFDPLLELIRYGQDRGEFRKDLDARVVMAVLHAARTGALVHWYSAPDVIDLLGLSRDAVSLMVDGISASRKPKSLRRNRSIRKRNRLTPKQPSRGAIPS